MSKLLSLLYFSYPLALHAAVYFQHISLGLYWLALLLFITAGHQLLLQAKVSGMMLLQLSVALLLVIAAQYIPELAIKFIPLLFYVSLFALSAMSLRDGKVSLITQMACILRNVEPADLNKDVLNYTRLATKLWAVFFLLMGLASLSIAILASLQWWSFFTNFLSYLLIVLMFVFEFNLRKHLIGKQMNYTMKEFFKRIRGIKMAQVLRFSK